MTDAAKTKQTFDNLVNWAKHSISSGEKKLVKFAEEFAKDPVYALSWSRDAFTAAADIKVRKEFLEQLELAEEKGLSDETFVNIKNYLTRRVLDSARWVYSSTSQTSNLMEAELNAAKARLLSDFNFVM